MTNQPTSCTKKQAVCVIRIVITNKFKFHIIHRMHIKSVLIQEFSSTAQYHVCLLIFSALSLKTMSEITISYYFPFPFSHSLILPLYRCDRQTLLHELAFLVNCSLQDNNMLNLEQYIYRDSAGNLHYQ